MLLNRIVKGLMLSLVFASLLACSKISQENFNKVQVGMTYDEVTSILGKPTDSQSLTILKMAATSATWRDSGKTISIQFLDNKVKVKSYIGQDGKEYH